MVLFHIKRTSFLPRYLLVIRGLIPVIRRINMCINISLTLFFKTTTTKHFHCVRDTVGAGRGSVYAAEGWVLAGHPFACSGRGNPGLRARLAELEGHASTHTQGCARVRPQVQSWGREDPSPAKFFQIAFHTPLSPLAGAAGLHSGRCPGPLEWKSLP